jgi:MYXO-CTERM domain-containing protein
MSALLLACAVCGAGEDPARGTYVVMTLIISGLPLAMLGGIAWWVIKSNRTREAEERAAQNASAEPR